MVDADGGLNRFLPFGDHSFPLLQYVDPYGNVVFNPLQMPQLLVEVELLLNRATDQELRLLLEKLRELAILCRDSNHLYLRFVGDKSRCPHPRSQSPIIPVVSMGRRNTWTNSQVQEFQRLRTSASTNAKKRRPVEVKTNDSPERPPRCNLLLNQMTRGVLHRPVELAPFLMTWPRGGPDLVAMHLCRGPKEGTMRKRDEPNREFRFPPARRSSRDL